MNELALKVEVIQKEGSIQFNNFEDLKMNVNKTLEKYRGLTLTEDNKQELKKARASLNSVASELDSKRKDVKKEYIRPLELFEDQVKEVVGLIKSASNELDLQVKEQENQEKKAKEEVIKAYFEELKTLNALDFITFEDINLNITLTVSEKKLKEEVLAFVEKTLFDLEEINSDQNRDRLLSKYRISKNLQKSRIELNRELEQERVIVEPKEEVITVEKVPVLEEILTAKFTVKTTLSKIKKLKNFLEMEGIEYE